MSQLFTVRQLQVGGFDHNFSYLVIGTGGEAALIDPTGDAGIIRNALRAAGEGIKSAYILLTHAHRDHTSAVAEIRKVFPAPVLAHPDAGFPGAMPLIDGQQLPLGEGRIEVIFAPGHTRDSVVYRLSDDSGLFTGDTLFVGCCGFCDAEPMFDTLAKLAQLPGSNVIYSGHDYGATPTALLADELKNNPYLGCRTLEEFKAELQNLT